MGTISTDREYDGAVDSSSVGRYRLAKRTLDLPIDGFGSNITQNREMRVSLSNHEGSVND